MARPQACKSALGEVSGNWGSVLRPFGEDIRIRESCIKCSAFFMDALKYDEIESKKILQYLKLVFRPGARNQMRCSLLFASVLQPFAKEITIVI